MILTIRKTFDRLFPVKTKTLKNTDTQLESKLQKKILRYAKDLGILSYSIKHVSNEKGFPDTIFFLNGWCMLLEIKRGKKGVTSIAQRRALTALMGERIPAYLVKDFMEAKGLLDKFKFLNRIDI